jgi:hypothetical protein
VGGERKKKERDRNRDREETVVDSERRKRGERR